MSWTLHVPEALVSLNELKGGSNIHAQRKRYKKLRRAYGWALVAAGVKQVPKAEGRRQVRITRLMGPKAKPYDPDNLVGGSKPLVDELVAFFVLCDDSEEHAAVEYDQQPAEQNGTRIEIWEDA